MVEKYIETKRIDADKTEFHDRDLPVKSTILYTTSKNSKMMAQT